jgi:hypothetical protein
VVVGELGSHWVAVKEALENNGIAIDRIKKKAFEL